MILRTKTAISIAITLAIILVAGITLLIVKPWKNAGASVCTYVQKSRSDNIKFLFTAENEGCPDSALDLVLANLLPRIDEHNFPEYLSNNQDVLSISPKAKEYFKNLLGEKKLKDKNGEVQVEDVVDWNTVIISSGDCAKISSSKLSTKQKLRNLVLNNCDIQYLSQVLPAIEKMNIDDTASALQDSNPLRLELRKRITEYNAVNVKDVHLIENSQTKSFKDVTDWKNVRVEFLKPICKLIFENPTVDYLISSLVRCRDQKTEILERLFPNINLNNIHDYLKGKEQILENDEVVTHVVGKVELFKSTNGRLLVLNEKDIENDIKSLKGRILHFQSTECEEAMKNVEASTFLQIVEESNCMDIGGVLSAEMNKKLPEIQDYATYLDEKRIFLKLNYSQAKLNERISEFNQKQNTVLILYDTQVHASVTSNIDWENVVLKDSFLEFQENHQDILAFLQDKTFGEIKSTKKISFVSCIYLSNQLEKNRRILYTGLTLGNCYGDSQVFFRHDIFSYLWGLNTVKLNDFISNVEQRTQLKEDFKGLKIRNPGVFYFAKDCNYESIEEALEECKSLYFLKTSIADWFYHPQQFKEKQMVEFLDKFGKTDGYSISNLLYNSGLYWSNYLSNVVSAILNSFNLKDELLKNGPNKKIIAILESNYQVTFNAYRYTYKCTLISDKRVICET